MKIAKSLDTKARFTWEIDYEKGIYLSLYSYSFVHYLLDHNLYL